MRKHKRSFSTTQAVLWFSLLSVGWFIGCTPKIAKEPLPITLPDSFSNTGSAALPSLWWESFEDPAMNQAVQQAIDSNFSLRSAYYRFQALEKVVDRESSYMLPTFATNAQYGISRPEPDFVGGENTRLSLYANYEVDLWGRIRSSIDAERFRAGASRFSQS